jgi:IS30 family transposase
MARRRDAQLEDKIRELDSRGLSLREIAKQVGRAPSNVSRVLLREPSRQLFDELSRRVAVIEGNQDRIRVFEQVIRSLVSVIPPWHPCKREVLNMLRSEPKE